MNVIRLHASGDLRLHSEPEPKPGPGEALVRVTAVGICGSDLHWFADQGIGDAQLDRPLVLGHEFAGVTEDGIRVAVDPSVPCGRCEYCQQGHPNLCGDQHFAGHGTDDGALREIIAWPTHCFHVLPDALSDIDGAMLEPLGVAIHAADLGHLKTGMSVGVFGCGPIGLLIIQLARLSGAVDIIATDKLANRLDAARSLGATQVFQAGDEGQERGDVWAAAGERGVDVAFEIANESAAVETAIEAARPGGCVVLGGIPGDDQIAFKASTARRKGLTIKLVRRMKHTYPRAIRLVESGRIDVRAIVTHRFPLADCAEAFKVAAARSGLKVVVEP
ncbi:MAG: zinc-binding dehydrogenase [Anaerolineae bacterium]|nr:zinc-binding dehydrogenase [Anaerolineae bacterium]